MLEEHHTIDVTWVDGWFEADANVPGRELFFNIDFEDDGLVQFNVAHSSGYYGDATLINELVKHHDQFLFNGILYTDITTLSIAMLEYELSLASNDEIDIPAEDISEHLEQVRRYANR